MNTMMRLRKSNDRGRSDYGWLQSSHTFSFGDYHDQNWEQGPLRVINEDYIGPGGGFGMHPHRNMEIITYVLEGAVEHKDSLGSAGIIRPGEIQKMTAGKGIRHSEFNASNESSLHLLQIWIVPNQMNLEPSYEQKTIEKTEDWSIIASPDGPECAVTLHQDAILLSAHPPEGKTITYTSGPHRLVWLQVARGAVECEGEKLNAGDGAGFEPQDSLQITATADSELLLFDMPFSV